MIEDVAIVYVLACWAYTGIDAWRNRIAAWEAVQDDSVARMVSPAEFLVVLLLAVFLSPISIPLFVVLHCIRGLEDGLKEGDR